MNVAEANTPDEHFDPSVAASAADDAHASTDGSLGQRLCAAREARGWSRVDVATRLKLPAQLIARLERDDYADLGEGVFLRGYLGSYARLVGVPVELAHETAAANTKAAPLVATGTISHSRYLFDRYSVSATYLILTAIIVVPAVWLATHGGLEQNLARTTPLDPPAEIAALTQNDRAEAPGRLTDAAGAAAATAAPGNVTSTAPLALDPSPVIASMAPFSSLPAATPVPTAPEPARAEVVGAGSHTLDLKLDGQSWVEITAADGRKLEYGMLAAQSEHSYRSEGPLSVRLGNAQGAEVRADGALIDLAPYQRSNVASLKLFAPEQAANHPSEQ